MPSKSLSLRFFLGESCGQAERLTQGNRFAVIADEAHSSQSGEAAAKLKAVLSAEELAELNDGDENTGITFVAFTATPKAKTLELFGRRPNPAQPASDTNKPEPIHVYSMRQAIEEGFTLDVLRNYTNYKLAFRLAHNGASYDEAQVEKSAARCVSRVNQVDGAPQPD